MSLSAMEEQLMQLLSADDATPIGRIAEQLYVSESTARRYVAALAKKGWVIRTHGGCLLCHGAADRNTPMYIRFSSEQDCKRKMAELAATLIPPAATVFLDSSSTAFHLAPYLGKERGTVAITSGLKTAISLIEHNVRTICLGGEIRADNLSASSTAAVQSVADFNADVFFFSCDALSDEGRMTDDSYEECLLRRAFMKHAEKKVLMVDPSKRGKRCPYTLGDLRDVDYCITVVDGEAVFLDRATFFDRMREEA